MPLIFGTTILTVTFDGILNSLSITGQAFSETEYVGVSDIQVSLTGLGAWSSVDTITTWGDELVEGSFIVALAAGHYDVRVISSDGEVSNTEVDSFTVSASAVAGPVEYSRQWIGIGIGI